MKAINFEGNNFVLAEDQPEYESLPVHVKYNIIPEGEVPWEITACFEFSDEEIQELIKTKKLYYSQLVFGNLFHPMRLSLKNPVDILGDGNSPEVNEDTISI